MAIINPNIETIEIPELDLIITVKFVNRHTDNPVERIMTICWEYKGKDGLPYGNYKTMTY